MEPEIRVWVSRTNDFAQLGLALLNLKKLVASNAKVLHEQVLQKCIQEKCSKMGSYSFLV